MNANKLIKNFRKRNHDKFSFEVGVNVAKFMDSMNVEGFWNSHCLGLDFENMRKNFSEECEEFLKTLKQEPPAFGIFLQALCDTIEAEMKRRSK